MKLGVLKGRSHFESKLMEVSSIFVNPAREALNEDSNDGSAASIHSSASQSSTAATSTVSTVSDQTSTGSNQGSNQTRSQSNPIDDLLDFGDETAEHIEGLTGGPTLNSANNFAPDLNSTFRASNPIPEIDSSSNQMIELELIDGGESEFNPATNLNDEAEPPSLSSIEPAEEMSSMELNGEKRLRYPKYNVSYTIPGPDFDPRFKAFRKEDRLKQTRLKFPS